MLVLPIPMICENPESSEALLEILTFSIFDHNTFEMIKFFLFIYYYLLLLLLCLLIILYYLCLN